MPVNRNALIRYKTIDKCLQNRYRKWTLDDLIDACSDALYDYEGIDKGVSKRTVQADIQMMRSDKLGYNAPIIVVDKKYYAYEDIEYSITNIPITDQDLDKLYETVEFLKQFKGFSHFKELDGMVQKLEDHVYSQKESQKPVIDFEKNENLKGLEFLDQLYQSIINRKAIKMTYQSFKARSASSFDFHCYLLKEFRNRWFVIGIKKRNDNLLTLALDRIIRIEDSEEKYIPKYDFDAKLYFKDAIGVSISPNVSPEEVVLFVTHKHAPYVLTKPLHPSQKLMEKDNYGITISLNVQHNFELEKEILGFGDGMKVIAPQRLKRNIKERLNAAIDLYNTEINENGLISASRKLKHKGFSILNFVYTQREIRKVNGLIEKYFQTGNQGNSNLSNLLGAIPALKEVLINKNIKSILQTIDEKIFLTQAIYYEFDPSKNQEELRQDNSIRLAKKKNLKGFSNWRKEEQHVEVTPPLETLDQMIAIYIQTENNDEDKNFMQVLPGSHKKVLTSTELETITLSSIPHKCKVEKGGIVLMKPLLLHSHFKLSTQRKNKIIKLVFSWADLPEELEWAEKRTI